MQRVFITGAGRGIGLELARQYVQRGDRVLAGYREPNRAPELLALREQHNDLLTLVQLEVGSAESIAAAVRLAHRELDGLDVLINNAAINPGDAFTEGPDGQILLDPERAVEEYRINSLAPLLIAQSFLTLLRAGANPRVVNISSGTGSLTLKTRGEDYSYAASKAALNMLTRAFAFSKQAAGITAVIAAPGWVRTDMGGPNALLDPNESVRGVIAVIDRLTPADTGSFWRYDGSPMPW
jgi:NAD(P)-dependent dehydrogenase (short-subunit alcohol dehydrogenase family)